MASSGDQNGNGSNRVTWAIVGAGACSVIILGCSAFSRYVLDRMDRTFERVSAVEREAAHLKGRLDELTRK